MTIHIGRRIRGRFVIRGWWFGVVFNGWFFWGAWNLYCFFLFRTFGRLRWTLHIQAIVRGVPWPQSFLPLINFVSFEIFNVSLVFFFYFFVFISPSYLDKCTCKSFHATISLRIFMQGVRLCFYVNANSGFEKADICTPVSSGLQTILERQKWKDSAIVDSLSYCPYACTINYSIKKTPRFKLQHICIGANADIQNSNWLVKLTHWLWHFQS